MIQVYEAEMQGMVKDPWETRNDYIRVIQDRSLENIEAFLTRHARKDLTRRDKVKLLKLMEIQRHAMLMYTSCGWFFDEVSGIETVQILQYAARTIQLAKDITQVALEQPFLSLLKKAPSNIPKFKNGASVYEQLVKPRVLDLVEWPRIMRYLRYLRNTRRPPPSTVTRRSTSCMTDWRSGNSNSRSEKH